MANEAGGYEREREARIKENMERMQKLGILDLANRFNQSGAGSGSGSGRSRSRWRRKPETPGSPVVMKPTASPAPSRRSLRLKSQDPVCYAEIRTKEEKDLQGGKCFSIEHGSREEVYTEEHAKLLGTCETPWTLFVDGYDKNGKRIYDQARGHTCHQCRQKTLGHHTSCCKCQIVQGQFCGDCLYMRYGENVLEAKKNPNWVCPVCRGICNCSICRTKKGWFPTGAAYRKIVKLGYKSVAHYLIATQRASDDSADSNSADSSNNLPPTKSEGSSNSELAVATKPELEDAQVTSKVSQNTRSDCLAVDSDGYMEDAGKDKTEQNEGNDKAPVEDEMIRAEGKGGIIDLCKDDSRSESAVTFEDVQGNQDNGCVTPSKPLRKRKLIERTPDCVASRLRSRSIKA